MQDMPAPSPTLGERAARISRISAKGVCRECEGTTFEIVIFGDGSHQVICYDRSCREAWAPIGEEQEPIARIANALGNGRDVASDMVSKTKEDTAGSSEGT